MSNIKLFEDRDAMVQNLKNQIIQAAGSNEEFVQFADIDKITDKATLETAKRGYKLTTSYITGTDKARKELTRQIDAVSKELREFESELTEPVKKIKEHLKIIIDDWEQAEQRRQMQIYQERVAKLTQAGYTTVGSLLVCGVFQLSAEQIQEMEDSDLDGWIEKGNHYTEMIRKQEEEKREMLAELEELRKMKAEIEREKQELAAQQQALEATYAQPEPIPQPEPVMTTPSLDFDLPASDAPDVEPIAPQYDAVSFNAGIQACVQAFENNQLPKKHLYIELFNGLLLPL